MIGYLALAPLGYLVWGTFFDEQGFTLRFFAEVMSQRNFDEVLVNSLVFAAASTVLSVALGSVLAYVIVRTDVPFKTVMYVGALLPLIVPTVLNTISWIFLLAPRTGLINRLLAPLSLGPFDLFSLGGMVFVETMDHAPLVFLLMAAALRSMEPALEESALMSGARLPTLIRRVTLPIVRPALFGALLVMAVSSLSSFEVPALLGMPDGTWTFTSRIFLALGRFPRQFGPAGAYSVILLVLVGIGLYLHSRLGRRGAAFQTITGKGYRPRLMQLGQWRWPVTVSVLAYLFVTVVLPLLIVVYASFRPYFASVQVASLTDLSLDNYFAIFERSDTVRAFRNSFILAVSSATSVMLVTAVASWIVVRTKSRVRFLLDNLAFLPIVIPGLVLGVALLFVYLRHPLPIYGTLWILFIAYVTKYIPFGMRFAGGSMAQIGAELEESASLSGASWVQSFRKIVLPLLAPGLIAGWIYVLIVSLRELSAPLLLYSPGNEVLSVKIWELWAEGLLTRLAAMGVLMVALLIVLTAAAYKIGSRVGIRAATADTGPLPAEL